MSEPYGGPHVLIGVAGKRYIVGAQSRNRIITPWSDNHGFAKWVHDNSYTLVKLLGPGTHFGEWWGIGIKREYRQRHKNFSLFNTGRWVGLAKCIDSVIVDHVPVLYQGCFDTDVI
ncbi:RNA ligase family protein, partial [Streptomyces sp. NPDC087850]|uniref:RNA ligase family protein n=1 Tax=Streptomyces sp. NPDC087850 TaxID=3365809 RepID=UPI00382BC54A